MQTKKLFLLFLVVIMGINLLACGSQTTPALQPAITTGALDTAEAYLLRGDQYAAIRDFDHAIADYSQAIQMKPNYAEAYNNRGLAYALMGKNEMAYAIADYTQAIQFRPDYAYAYNNRGVAYMASGHPEEALSDFNRAIQLKPDFTQAYSNRGNYYFRAHHTFLAVYDFSRAWKIPLIIIASLGILIILIIMLVYRALRKHHLAQRH